MASVRIPVKDMALEALDHILPQCTPEQIAALRAGLPVPPSPDWTGGAPGLPLVSGVLVFSAVARLKLARRAVNQFVRQDYQRKQLVVVNNTALDVTNVSHPEILEIRVEGRRTLGNLRNYGLDHAQGDWVIPCWDDDDFHHPLRLAFQMAHRDTVRASLLKCQLRVDLGTGAAYLEQEPLGIPNTMLVPRSTEKRFQDLDSLEDSTFCMQHYHGKILVVDNSRFPADVMSVAVYHNHNVLTRAQFMGAFADPERRGIWELDQDEMDFLYNLLKSAGVETTPLNPGEAPLSPWDDAAEHRMLRHDSQ